MNHHRYDLKWIGHFQKDTSDKIWGWFYFNGADSNISNKPAYCYVFWARTGKTPSFKKHFNSFRTVKQLEAKKIDGKYKKITETELLTLWPTFFEDIDKKFIFHLLSDNI